VNASDSAATPRGSAVIRAPRSEMVYVCVRVCVYVCVYVDICVHILHLQLYIYVCIYVYIAPSGDIRLSVRLWLTRSTTTTSTTCRSTTA